MSIRKLSKVRKNDPHFRRESTKYEMPLPSREYVIQVLADQGRPVSFDFLCDLLDVHKVERDSFARRLAAMEREAQLMRNRKGAYILPERASLIAGRVEGHADGYGFLIPDDGSDDLFLDAKQMTKVLHRDRALVRMTGIDRKGRREAAIVEVIERANTRVVGRVIVEHGITLVAPENKRINQDILVVADRKTDKTEKKLKYKAGQVVMVEIIEQPTRHSQPIGRIVEVLGNYADPGMEIEIALRKHDLPFEFSKAALEENKKMPLKVRKMDLKGREEILKVHAKKVRMADDVNFHTIARMAAGASGAELANIINEGALRAVRSGRSEVTEADLEESIEVVIAGYQKKNAILSDAEKRTVAYHEIGHALVAALQSHSAPVQKITIIPRTSGALGYTMQVEQQDKYILSREELENKIATFTAGRAAEEVKFGLVSTGASNDIEQATKLARAMITRYGMSDEFDMVAMETVNNRYLGGDTSLTCSAATQQQIDKKVVELVRKQHEKAIALLKAHMDKLDALASYLYEKETITGDEFMKILEGDKSETQEVESAEQKLLADEEGLGQAFGAFLHLVGERQADLRAVAEHLPEAGQVMGEQLKVRGSVAPDLFPLSQYQQGNLPPLTQQQAGDDVAVPAVVPRAAEYADPLGGVGVLGLHHSPYLVRLPLLLRGQRLAKTRDMFVIDGFDEGRWLFHGAVVWMLMSGG